MPRLKTALRGITLGLTLAALVAGTAFAGKPGGGGGGSTTSGSCSVSPNPVTRGGSYTVSGWGLPANTFVNVNVTDSVGTSVMMSYTSSTGTLSVNGLSAWSGTSKVTIVGQSGKKSYTYATCSFLVQ